MTEQVDWAAEKEKELIRWQEREPFLRQEYARELGVHQGRMSIYEENINKESNEESPKLHNIDSEPKTGLNV